MEEEVLLGGATVFKERRGKVLWLLVKPGRDDGWQLPKSVVRRGESSVRSTINTVRLLAGMRCFVLEEVGRVSSTTTHKSMPLTRRIIYYLVQQRGGNGEAGYAKLAWVEHIKARSQLGTASEKRMLAQARIVLSEWRKQDKHPQPD